MIPSPHKSIPSIYEELIDDIDYILLNDTSIKGVMSQRLQASRAWFCDQLKIEAGPPIGCVQFGFKDGAPIPKFAGKGQIQSAIVPILEDKNVSGLIIYQGFDKGSGYYNYYLSGMCPNHMRVHDGQAWKWVLKVKEDHTWAGFKCWRDNTFHKICCIDQLLPTAAPSVDTAPPI